MDQLERAMLRLMEIWGCAREDLRPVKGDDRILVYRKLAEGSWREWPCLPEACIQKEGSDLVITCTNFARSHAVFERHFVPPPVY